MSDTGLINVSGRQTSQAGIPGSRPQDLRCWAGRHWPRSYQRSETIPVPEEMFTDSGWVNTELFRTEEIAEPFLSLLADIQEFACKCQSPPAGMADIPGDIGAIQQYREELRYSLECLSVRPVFNHSIKKMTGS